jgi:hypothetical protein
MASPNQIKAACEAHGFAKGLCPALAKPNRNANGFFGIGEAIRFAPLLCFAEESTSQTASPMRSGADGGELLYRAVPSAQEDSSYLCIEDNKRTAKAIS